MGPLLPQGERGVALGADFSFASSDFKTLGAFFCNFPSRSSRQLRSRQRERGDGAPFARRRPYLQTPAFGTEVGQSSSMFPRIASYSNGCVSFKDYDAFLRAYQNGEIKKLAAVARL